ncbi:neurotensin receptor type 1 [Ailuropoda melanoleuca]|uniref:neurotensin receptor type 1 n=1 Tax=Ailuropoda melanoleuca TaxID=9646 RepID=UPI001494A89F|nr:neurotensin receptor type 1 [Ailuropoda melanoleuca]
MCVSNSGSEDWVHRGRSLAGVQRVAVADGGTATALLQDRGGLLVPELDAWEISATPPAACLGSRDHEASRSQSAPLALTVFVLVFKLCPFLRTRVFKMDQPTPFFTDKKQAQPENGRRDRHSGKAVSLIRLRVSRQPSWCQRGSTARNRQDVALGGFCFSSSGRRGRSVLGVGSFTLAGSDEVLSPLESDLESGGHRWQPLGPQTTPHRPPSWAVAHCLRPPPSPQRQRSSLPVVGEINTFMSFVFPMVVISILNTIIANKLTIMVRQAAEQGQVCTVGDQHSSFSMSIEPGRVQALRHGVRVLRAVVIAFVVCWLPYHVRRLMFCYVSDKQWTPFLYDFYHYFYLLTNALFYVSSAVNPVLYNLVSANFRQAFLSTLACLCPLWGRRRKRPAFSRKTNSVSSNHTFSSNVTRETLY